MPKADLANHFHIFWGMLDRGISDILFSGTSGQRARKRAYFGRMFRVPRSVLSNHEGWGAIAQRETDEFARLVLNGIFDETDPQPAVGEFLERFEAFDLETGDVLVMHRVPYMPEGERPARPAATLPIFSRRRNDQDRNLTIPPTTSDEARALIDRLMRLLDKHAAFRGMIEDVAAEQRALALLTVAAAELASIESPSYRQIILDQLSGWLHWMVTGKTWPSRRRNSGWRLSAPGSGAPRRTDYICCVPQERT